MKFNDIKPDKGKLLISAPNLTDFFKRTVIILVENNENGSLGFVINKPLKYKVNEIIEGFPDLNSGVYIGGPVQTDVVNFIHTAGDIIEGAYEIEKGIYWGGKYESVKLLYESGKLNPDKFIFFLGYAGWSPNQLTEELIANSWFVTDATPDIVFNTESQNLWQKVLRNMGGEYSIMSTFPEDPTVN
jgi:putative transcriptional regulator